jgi:hypothetical protein
MFLQRILAASVFIVSTFAAPASLQAESADQSGNGPTVIISNNSGGNIASFALNAADYRNSGALIKFNGRCDSACTLYLGLPSRQTCISQGAYFRFHSPHSASARSVKLAQAYLMQKYPGWVRSWISRNNGLSSNLITMDYSYASKFIRPCSAVASR